VIGSKCIRGAADGPKAAGIALSSRGGAAARKGHDVPATLFTYPRALLAGGLGDARRYALADAASAQPINGRGRWCQTFVMYGGTLDCSYHSLEQCMASAAGVSNQCSLNPWYAGRPEPGPRRRDQWR